MLNLFTRYPPKNVPTPAVGTAISPKIKRAIVIFLDFLAIVISFSGILKAYSKDNLSFIDLHNIFPMVNY